MGSFDSTCAISGLPISGGHSVRLLLLTENPYGEPNACTMHDVWFPRTFPLKGTYDTYGSAEELEAGPARDVWLDGLKIDLVEVGVGDNSCHDVATSRDMSFGAMLGAVQQGRVIVKRDLSKTEWPDTADGDKAGVPTLQRVTTALTLAGFTVTTKWRGETGADLCFHVDEEEALEGSVRVRLANFGMEAEMIAALEWAQAALQDYATVITCGSGSYANAAELLVRPRPSQATHRRMSRRQNEPLAVRQALIREDIWQAIIARGARMGQSAPKPRPFSAFLADARKMWDRCLKELETEKKFLASVAALKDSLDEDLRKRLESFMFSEGNGARGIVGALIGKEPIPFTVGLSTHFRLMVEKAAAGQVTEAQRDAFLESVAGLCLVEMALSPVRYWWRPSHSCGPQHGEYRLHETMLLDFAGVAKKIADHEDAERAKWEREIDEPAANDFPDMLARDRDDTFSR